MLLGFSRCGKMAFIVTGAGEMKKNKTCWPYSCSDIVVISEDGSAGICPWDAGVKSIVFGVF